MQISNIYIYRTHFDAENALRQLSHSGFDMKNLSIVGRGYQIEEQPIGFYAKGERVKTWGKFGAFWGAVWGLLFTPAIFVLPGIGVIPMAGPVVTALVSTLEGSAIGAGISVLGCALLDLGVHKNDVIRYLTALKADDFLLIVHGDTEEMRHAYRVLNGPRPQLGFSPKEELKQITSAINVYSIQPSFNDLFKKRSII
jgi:hypothetical protein